MKLNCQNCGDQYFGWHYMNMTSKEHDMAEKYCETCFSLFKKMSEKCWPEKDALKASQSPNSCSDDSTAKRRHQDDLEPKQWPSCDDCGEDRKDVDVTFGGQFCKDCYDPNPKLKVERKCENCDYFEHVQGPHGECRRNAPVQVPFQGRYRTEHPSVCNDSWCGEFKAKEQK